MLKGLTVWYLLHKTFKVEPGHRVLIHAAAGGIGLLACQWARALGAHVIGTVGSKAKADLALSNGCDHVILYNEENFVDRVKQISRGELCDVVYDGVGKTTFPGALSCLRPRGLFVSFGNASGPVPPFALAELNNHGSLFATRPKLNDYVSTRKDLLEGADTLFAAVINGKLHVPINHAYALKDVAKAHIELEGRATTGAVILRPPRTSPRPCRADSFCSSLSRNRPASTADFRKAGSATCSSTARPAAHINGLPLKVPPWSPCSKHDAYSVASNAASGTPPPMPLPSVMMSGSIPACS